MAPETSRKVLELLEGHTSKNPMFFSVMQEKTGIFASDLRAVVDELFDAHEISRSWITQGSVTELGMWPTGISAAVPFRPLKVNPHQVIERRPLPIAQPKQEQPTMEQQKTKTQIMLDLLMEKGQVTTSELAKAASTNSIKPFLGKYVERGLINVEEADNSSIYSIVPGVTPEQLLGRKKRKARAQPLAAAATTLPTPAPIEAVPAADAEPDSAAPIPAVALDIITEALKASAADKAEPQNEPKSPRFRLAITSDKTIMLFGLASQPIELSCEQTRLLTEFVSDKAEILCV